MLNTLRLSQFRCYPSLCWELPAEGALLLGDNAQGKTSLLEAICFALTLHSPRTTRLDRLAQHGCSSFGISLDTTEGKRRVRWRDRHLELSWQGLECRDYADYLREAPPVTWLGNGDIALVRGAAEERRAYLDFLGAQWHPAYREALPAYRKALRSRNALLRHPRRNRAALRSFDELLCRHGSIITELRRRLLELIQPHISDHHSGISQGRELVELHYRPSTELPLDAALARCFDEDERLGFTTLGPHRDDFCLMIGGVEAALFASEGQQRTLATAMRLAEASLLEAETGQAAVLLIDDVFGELDPGRRRSLLERLPVGAQVFITTTHLNWLGADEPPLPVMPIRGAQLGN